MSDRRAIHSQLKDVTRRYGQALDRFEQGMRHGDVDRADQALAEMQDIEASVTIIERAKK